MTAVKSSSTEMDLSMEENTSRSRNNHQHQALENRNKSCLNNRRSNGYDCRNNGVNAGGDEDDKDGGGGDEECDVEAWQTLTESFNQVQSVLDQNRVLIQQVNENHRSKIPDNLVKNVSLIREINGNISKVISLYSGLSVNFSNIVHQRREIAAAAKNNGNGNNCSRGYELDDSAE